MALVLAIESSCDETACAIVDGTRILSSVVRSQIDVHARFGGVVPELASRHHLGAITPVIRAALADAGITWNAIEAIAVTEGPGLVGALLVGVEAAHGLALARGLPLYGVHHLEGHLFSAILGTTPTVPLPPHVALIVSGGHTELVAVTRVGSYRMLGATRDDAAGEAYDKAAKLLGLGYPGGPIIDRLAREGDGAAHQFPRAMLDRPGYEFSFSGLKTALSVHLQQHGQPQSREALADLCASYQAAIVDVLVHRARRAVAAEADALGTKRLHIVGGVAANAGLRQAAKDAAERDGFTLCVPALAHCGDNAAMIAAAASARIVAGCRPSVELHTALALDEPRQQIA